MPRRLWQVILIAVSITPAWCQNDGAHWGVQGDGGYFLVPSFIVDDIHSLPEAPSIEGASFQVGLVRFNDRGAPSYAFQYSQLRAGLDGSLSDDRGTASVSGSARIRGFMATKYLNFFTNGRVSAGVALGGGVGKLDAFYTRSVVSRFVVGSEVHRYDYTVPLFEILGRFDVPVTRNLTVGPFYGICDGLLGGGVSVRVHFR